MAYINGKNIPFVYHAVPTASNVKVVTGFVVPESGTKIFTKRDLGFKPDIVIWNLYEVPTDPEATVTSYAISDSICGLTFNITWANEVGGSSSTRPIRIYSDGFTARPAYDTNTTFNEGVTYQWIAIKSEG